jgi:hypothetical protein
VAEGATARPDEARAAELRDILAEDRPGTVVLVQQQAQRPVGQIAVLRVALAVFVLAWIFGPYGLRSAVPVWVVFVVALGLEAHFFLGALRRGPARRPDRRPLAVDRERYGYAEAETGELLLVREGSEELWIPYAGETDEELDALIEEARELRAEATSEPAFERAGLLPPVRSLLTGVGLIAALALVLWVVQSRTGWEALDSDTRVEATARFAEEASRIAGKDVSIRCDESGDYVGAVQHADGVASVGGRLAFLTPARCHDLYRLAFEGEVRSSQTGRAIAVLAHEAWHLRGVGDEGTTECYALQSGVELGRRLGLSEGRARQLMRQQLTENALRRGASLEYRLPAECRNGGRLDLAAGDSAFP